jgi:hypothetical protein
MRRFCSLLIVLGFVGVNTFGQSTAQISGYVRDSTGAVLPGVQITATQTDTGIARNTVTDETGVYVLPNLALGPYRLEAALPGFRTFAQTGIVLQVNTNAVINVTLQVGQVAETIEVQANAAMVETEKISVGSIVENQRILELPLNGRNAFELIQLSGAAVNSNLGSAGASLPGAQTISVAGGLTYGVAYRLDGAVFNNPYDATSMPFPFPDALQEFKVETSSLTAQNGEHSGANINAVTKSGTNAYHGDAFEFLRNGIFNARNSFASARDTLKRNQYGGTVGGPIKQNKLFFFAGYQGTRNRQDPSDNVAFVPTAQMLAGDFTSFASAACNSSGQINLPSPFVVNRVSPTLFSKAALAVVSYLPKSDDPCGRVNFGARIISNVYQILGRIDYERSAKHTIFGRYMATKNFQPAPVTVSSSVLGSTSGGHDQLAQSFTLGDTYLLSSTTINSFRLAFNRTASHTLGGEFFSGCDAGVKMYCYVPHESTLSVNGGFTVGGALAVNAILSPTTYQLGDDLSLVRGGHQLAFGWSQYQYRSTTIGGVNSQGTFSFNGAGTGNGMADFLLGNLGTLTQGGPNTLFTRKNFLAAYAQDTWKVTRRFTVNFGIRWEPFLPQTMTDGAVYNFSLSRFQQGIKSTVFENAPAGLTFPGDPGFQGKEGMNHQWNLFAPRVGFAWDPMGDGRMSIRAGYGLTYDFVNGQFFATTTLAPPFGNLTRITGPVSFDDPWANVPGGNIFPYTLGRNAPFTSFGSFLALRPDLKTTGVHAWNLSIQRQIGANLLVSGTYAGSEAEHVWQSYQLNPGVIVPSTFPIGTCPAGVTTGCNSTNNLNQRRVLYLQRPQDAQLIGYLDQIDDGATQSYNGLILSAQQRLAKGVSVNANYTWSHCIGYNNIGAGPGGVGSGYLKPDDRSFDRGNCSTDRRRIFNLTAVAQTPRFTNNTLRMIGTGWRLSAIYRNTSGSYLTVTSSTDRQLSGASGQRLNQVNLNPLCDDPRPSCWINPAAFTTPALGTLGNMGKANILGPGFFQFDTALSREFRLREGQALEIRAEAFNVTNSFRAGGVTTTQNANFGRILTALDPRIMQFAMKFVF